MEGCPAHSQAQVTLSQSPVLAARAGRRTVQDSEGDLGFESKNGDKSCFAILHRPPTCTDWQAG